MDGAQTCLHRHYYWLDDGHEENPSSETWHSSGTGHQRRIDHHVGQLSRLSGTKPQLTSPLAGNSRAPSRMFGWRPPGDPATGTARML